MNTFALLACCIAVVASSPIEEEQPVIAKRFLDPASIATYVAAGIGAGTTLASTSVSALQAPGYNVRASGSIENYTKFPLIKKEHEVAAGWMNHIFITIGAGLKEGFASHKTGNTAKGTWVYGRFQLDYSTYVHVSYSIPYSKDFHSNTLSLAICGRNDAQCKSLDANKMYYNHYSWMDRKEFYSGKQRSAQICARGFCIIGDMGNDNAPTINIKVYASDLKNVAGGVREALKKHGGGESDYKNFIHDQFY